MNKIRVLLVSLLKPVNDTRMYEKLGLTLSSLPSFQINVAGYAAPLPPAPANVNFHPIFHFPRLSSGRFLAQFRYLRLLHRLRPHLVIVGTHELLLSSVLYRLIYGGRLIYDVRENYALNLRSQNVYPPVVRQVLAGLVRLVERLSAPLLDHFLLAERSYASELPFLGKKFTVVENKVIRRAQSIPLKEVRVQPEQQQFRLLYSGTISPLFGILDAVAFFQRWQAVNPRVELVIVGHCPQQQVLEELQGLIAGNSSICLIGGTHLVPHQLIEEQIRLCHVGLLPYRLHPSTFSCIPTKLYEYLGHSLPLLVQQNPYWEPLVHRHQAGLFVDFPNADPAVVEAQFRQKAFYPEGPPEEVFWDQEALNVVRVVQEVMREHY